MFQTIVCLSRLNREGKILLSVRRPLRSNKIRHIHLVRRFNSIFFLFRQSPFIAYYTFDFSFHFIRLAGMHYISLVACGASHSSQLSRFQSSRNLISRNHGIKFAISKYTFIHLPNFFHSTDCELRMHLWTFNEIGVYYRQYRLETIVYLRKKEKKR